MTPVHFSLQQLLNDYKELSEKDLSATSLKEYLALWTTQKERIEEQFAFVYIDYTCHTNDEEKSKKLNEAIDAGEEFAKIGHVINTRVIELTKKESPEPFLSYAIKILKNSLDLFREENLPIEIKDQKLAQEYQALVGALTIQYNGHDIPLSIAKTYLENTDRKVRRDVFEKIQNAYAGIKEKVNELFNTQVELRTTVAQNANFANYRDFSHIAKNRFDYTPQDCLDFNKAILDFMVPVATTLYEKRKQSLNLEKLEPFDTSVDPYNKPALKPANTESEFFDKDFNVLHKVSPYVSATLQNLKENNNLDLFARNNKAPGGYNFPLTLSKSSFIFMNCAFTHGDMVTLFHEMGHAYHFDCYKNNKHNFVYQSPPSEVAELASMSMELMSMEHWNFLYSNAEDLKRAKLKQLEGIIHLFPWVCVVDGFQQWIYLNPKASITQRNNYFKDLYTSYFPAIDWVNFNAFLPTSWQKQLHIIEVPFYYIEYAIAQLGALQIWENYKKNPVTGFENYTKALSLGSVSPIHTIYETAGIKLSFNSEMVKHTAKFLLNELSGL